MAKEKPIEVDGKIQETLPNATFRVVLDNDHVISVSYTHLTLPTSDLV